MGAGCTRGPDALPRQVRDLVMKVMALHHAPALALSLMLATGAVQWRNAAPMRVALGNHAAAGVDGEVLVAGGTTWRAGTKLWLDDVWAYDRTTDRWRRAGELPRPVGGAVGISAGNALYVLGGSDGTGASAHCYRLRLHGGKLRVDALPDLPEGRVYAAGARAGRYLCVVGGCTDPAHLGTATASLFALDLSNREAGWQILDPLPGPARVVHAAAGGLGSLYVFGGCYLDDAGTVVNLGDAWRYDLHDRSWERLPDLPRPNRALTAIGVGADGVLLMGGYTATAQEAAGGADDFGFSAEVLRYDPDRRTYDRAGELPEAAACPAAVRLGGELLVLGGEPAMRRRADWVWFADLHALLP